MISKSNKHKWISKELSWLSFNERVLQEAKDETTPLLERIRFLGIFASNLEEFFQVRFAELKRQLLIIKEKESMSAKKIRNHLAEIQRKTELLNSEFDNIYYHLMHNMVKYRIYFLEESDLSDTQKKWLRDYFVEHIRLHLFPIVINRDTDLLRALSEEGSQLVVELKLATRNLVVIIPIPSDLNSFVILPALKGRRGTFLILIDSIIRLCIDEIFEDLFEYQEIEAYSIMMTRDAEYSLIQEVEESFIEQMSDSLKQRLIAQPVRLLYERTMPKTLLTRLREQLNITSIDSIVKGGRYLSFKHLVDLPDVLGVKNLLNEKLPTVNHPACKHSDKLTFEDISKQDILLYYPYHNFNNIVYLLNEASFDPDVIGIKINIYRVAKDSKIVSALINAVNNGKKVTAVIEVQARFDEEANINLVKKLTDANINVVLSPAGFKIHSKLFLISRRENKKTVEYAHIGTGNFHEKTTKVYTDFTLLTKDPAITEEVKQVFNFIVKPYNRADFKYLLISPLNVRARLNSLIDREIKNAKLKKKSGIILKVNNLVDVELIEKLYTASNAGVKIRMIIRGMCSLRAGVPGLSENIQIISIIDRFLEHPRVYCFENNGRKEVYISSADWMTRNLDHRLEVGVAIRDPKAKKTILDILNLQLRDNCKARIIDAEQTNKYVSRKEDEPICRSQIAIYEYLMQQSKK